MKTQEVREGTDMFEIKKGTKQGDPLSSLLLNTVLQVALKDDLPRWEKKKGMGTCFRTGHYNHDHGQPTTS